MSVQATETAKMDDTADIQVDFSIYYPILPTAINVMNILIDKGYLDPDAFIYIDPRHRPFSKISRHKSDFYYS